MMLTSLSLILKNRESTDGSATILKFFAFAAPSRTIQVPFLVGTFLVGIFQLACELPLFHPLPMQHCCHQLHFHVHCRCAFLHCCFLHCRRRRSFHCCCSPSLLHFHSPHSRHHHHHPSSTSSLSQDFATCLKCRNLPFHFFRCWQFARFLATCQMFVLLFFFAFSTNVIFSCSPRLRRHFRCHLTVTLVSAPILITCFFVFVSTTTMVGISCLSILLLQFPLSLFICENHDL